MRKLKKMDKKLVLKKVTITNLDNSLMQVVHGGYVPSIADSDCFKCQVPNPTKHGVGCNVGFFDVSIKGGGACTD